MLKGEQEYTLGREVFIVDDHPANLKLLFNLLTEHGYVVRAAKSGEAALNMIKTKAPDLILLDIQMPGISGFEVCEKIKLDKLLKKIPIIFLSALDDIQSKSDGFQLGAVDYLTKPFNHQEVLVRIRTHLLNAINQQRLVQSEKMASLGELIVGFSHELNTPLGICRTSMSIIEDKLLSTKLSATSQGSEREQLVSLVSETEKGFSLANQSLDKAISLVQRLQEVSSLHAEREKIIVKIDDALRLVILSLSRYFESGKVQVNVIGDANLSVETYSQILFIVFRHIIENSVNHAFVDAHCGTITVNYEASQTYLTVSVCDDGVGISDTIKPRIMNPFFTTQRGKGKLGFGLHVVYNLISELDGSIECHSTLGEGTEFVIKIPIEAS